MIDIYNTTQKQIVIQSWVGDSWSGLPSKLDIYCISSLTFFNIGDTWSIMLKQPCDLTWGFHATNEPGCEVWPCLAQFPNLGRQAIILWDTRNFTKEKKTSPNTYSDQPLSISILCTIESEYKVVPPTCGLAKKHHSYDIYIYIYMWYINKYIYIYVIYIYICVWYIYIYLFIYSPINHLYIYYLYHKPQPSEPTSKTNWANELGQKPATSWQSPRRGSLRFRLEVGWIQTLLHRPRRDASLRGRLGCSKKARKRPRKP